MNLFSGRPTSFDPAWASHGVSGTAQPRIARPFRALGQQVDLLLVPGLFGSGPDHWQTHWEQAYGLRRLHQKDWETPDPTDWEAALTEAIEASARPTFLIAHSLGAVLTAKWLTRHGGRRVAGAFLVAPADIDQTTHPDVGLIQAFGPLPGTPLPAATAVMASSNDPWLSLPRARELAGNWQSDFLEAGAAGHIGSSEPLGLWEHGATAMLDFARRRLPLRVQ
ncbi:RBBP9/YdeN family alpha/beta hydrolase [Gluconobacter kondonii]|uniref:RBBP9/YdeN family alpha/beta hydrolase n=1 Tax=Gluconobacter kondonii TaxID=941463 RepID=UPI001B8AFEB9|nr:alpha/beta hydrolase [Gluconobacter kondonii]MBS1053293.1 alpha/beta hydrolase [Gluconobacter kondonii]